MRWEREAKQHLLEAAGVPTSGKRLGEVSRGKEEGDAFSSGNRAGVLYVRFYRVVRFVG